MDQLSLVGVGAYYWSVTSQSTVLVGVQLAEERFEKLKWAMSL